MAAENQTRPTAVSAEGHIASLDHPTRRADAEAALALYCKVTGLPAVMWGPGIIGFGTHHYRYETGREGDVPLACFAPRKTHITFYLHSKFEGGPELYARLGKYRMHGGCAHVNKLADVDLGVLREIVSRSYAHMQSHGLDLA